MGTRGPLPSPYARRRNVRPVRGNVTTRRPAMPRDLRPSFVYPGDIRNFCVTVYALNSGGRSQGYGYCQVSAP